MTTTFAPTINFNEIPPAGLLLVPGNYAEVAADYSNVGLLTFPTRLLIIGQGKFSGSGSGTGNANTIYTITRVDQGAAIFGAGTPLAEMIAYALASNPGLPIDAAGVAISGGTAAAGALLFGGTPKANATQAVGIAGFRIPLVITTSMTPANMASAFVTAANNIFNAQNLPVTLATTGTAGQVTVTANYQGITGNEIDIRINPGLGDSTVPGVTVGITPMTGGAGTQSLATILGAIASTWYTDIIVAVNNDSTSLGLIQTALASRYTAMQMVDSTCWACFTGTQSQMVAQLSGVDCQFLSVIGVTNPQDPSWRWAASFGAVAALALNNDPARQLRGLKLPSILAPALADQMFEPEQEALLAAGIATFGVAPDNSVYIQRAVTSYTTSTLGVPDAAWRDVMVAKVMTRIRWDWRNFLLLNWPRSKLSDDGSLASQYDSLVMTPRLLQGAWAARCKLYARQGWIENEDATIAASVFTRDPNDKNRVNSQRHLQIIGNFMIDAEQMLFAA